MRHKIITVAVSGALLIAAPFIVAKEGNILRGYADPIGVPTACAGVTGQNIKIGQHFTVEQCEEMNSQAMANAARSVSRLVKVGIDPYTEAALISFVYNVGEGAFSRSTLLRKLNSRDIEGACRQLPRWVYADGRKLAGLVSRRKEEMQMCLKGLARMQNTLHWKGR